MTDSICDIAVLLDETRAEDCQRLAENLSLPLIGEHESAAAFPLVLGFTDRGLALLQNGPGAPGPVLVDFVAGSLNHRRNHGGGELIVKAVSGHKSIRPTVVDATAGLGRDSFVLASWGYPVTLCERSPIVAALLKDGLLRAAQYGDTDISEVVQRLQLQSRDAVDYLRSLDEQRRPDVVVIDPMFPASNKTALVKKEMRAFHALVGPDQDSEVLLQTALAVARHRVVVKRPKKAQPLAGKAPNFSLPGKAIRFDIYALKAFDKHGS